MATVRPTITRSNSTGRSSHSVSFPERINDYFSIVRRFYISICCGCSSAPSTPFKTPEHNRSFDDSGRLLLFPSRGRDSRSNIVRHPKHTQMPTFTYFTICQYPEPVRTCQAEEPQRIPSPDTLRNSDEPRQ